MWLLRRNQQPFADAPAVANVPVMDEIPVQGVLEIVGAAGLSPGVPSSVEPSGTAPLADPGVKPVIVEPVAEVAALGEPEAPEVQPVVGVDIVPPPSKLELDPAVVAVP
ncbi:MAG: hypothetical protein J2P54_25690, partial [Bradyrhizobiaceae bacterium]|nr:hypothetical protein [Bradyrhizobiaceae bacterium]